MQPTTRHNPARHGRQFMLTTRDPPRQCPTNSRMRPAIVSCPCSFPMPHARSKALVLASFHEGPTKQCAAVLFVKPADLCGHRSVVVGGTLGAHRAQRRHRNDWRLSGQKGVRQRIVGSKFAKHAERRRRQTPLTAGCPPTTPASPTPSPAYGRRPSAATTDDLAPDVGLLEGQDELLCVGLPCLLDLSNLYRLRLVVDAHCGVYRQVARHDVRGCARRTHLFHRSPSEPHQSPYPTSKARLWASEHRPNSASRKPTATG